MPPRHLEVIVAPSEEIMVSAKRVACDGAGAGGRGSAASATLGHPLVYLDMGEDDFVECGYCDRRFVLAAGGHRETEYLDPAARGPEAH